ncbi:hypothetical protein N7471_010947, partial [Penicillium samsonianum]|uniref:uncharacterized protein n=1 Tax=Penicillium samsonianum TaxID=1882272 RepID=UPI002548D6E5
YIVYLVGQLLLQWVRHKQKLNQIHADYGDIAQTYRARRILIATIGRRPNPPSARRLKPDPRTAEARSREHVLRAQIAEVVARDADSRAEKLALELRDSKAQGFEAERRAFDAEGRFFETKRRALEAERRLRISIFRPQGLNLRTTPSLFVVVRLLYAPLPRLLIPVERTPCMPKIPAAGTRF